MISGIEGLSDYSQMSLMRSRTRNPFEKLDSDGDGSLDKVEISSMAEKLAQKTGESVDADEIVSKLDTDGDGLVSQEEFEAGRPEGPPPGMMGGGPMGSETKSLLSEMGDSEEDDSYDSVAFLDANGDGVVDADEARSGISRLILEYGSLMNGAYQQAGGNERQLNLFV
ncbi:MAG: EF-hand domain-containing protein [Deltaproteobacteria bacterium]|nr:EF-hand domain-containing protein [Deltaproteobacteria bacterium]